MRTIDELEQRSVEVSKGQNKAEFLRIATATLLPWMERNPRHWQVFGPWAYAIRDLLRKYQPEFTQPTRWNLPDRPAYLALYDRGNDLFNWVEAMDYLNRDGQYMHHPDDFHSIEMPDGDRKLYHPVMGFYDE